MSEHSEQVRFFQMAELYESQIPELFLLHAIPNGGKRHIGTAVKLKKEGVKSGVPDICFPYPAMGFNGLYIELKVKKNSRVSDNQKKWLSELSKAGFLAIVAYGCDEAWEILMKYLGKKGIIT